MRNVALILSVVLAVSVQASEPPPLEVYGRLPMMDLFELSPDGSRGASRVTYGGRDLIVAIDMATNEFLSGVDAAEVNPRWLRFANEEKIILVAGKTVRTRAVRSAFDYSFAYAFDIKSKDVRALLRKAPDLYPYQSGLGRVIGRDPATNTIYMPAFVGGGNGASVDGGVYAVRLDKRREKLVARGTRHTRDWFLGADHKPLVREDFDDKNNVHRLWLTSEKGKSRELLYEEHTEIPHYGVVGLTAERDALVLLTSSEWTGGTAYYLMSLADGSISGPVLDRENVEIESVIMDVNRVVYGVEYAGFKPAYGFFDAELNERVASIQRRLPTVASRLVTWSDDFAKLVFAIEGGWTSGAYVLFEKGVAEPSVIGRFRPDIGEEHVAPVEIVYYVAQDGLQIPALVTARKDIRDAGNAPVIVMPHGGPQAHDTYGFDWFAQFFASRGYVVLQPQFRGSDGFGHKHLVAGDGEWGGKMQSDLDDGVAWLIEKGIADPERVCMVGASYGGYAALAAGAFSPGMYKCIAAVAPVTDLRRKFRRARAERGRNDWAIDYWERLYGAEASEKDILKAISPSEHADAFQAPVLLIHGERDTVVHIDQSKIMHKALRKAGKDVEFIKLKGEDHWLSQEETRIQTLQALSAFIAEHL